MQTEQASRHRSDDLGWRALRFMQGSPRVGGSNSVYDLVAKFDAHFAVDEPAQPVVAPATASRVVFRDFDEFAEAINGIAGRFVPTARSEADWWVQVVRIGRVTLQQMQIGGASTYAGDGTDNALTIGIPMAQSHRIRIDGQLLDDSSFILVKAGQPFTFAAKQATRWTSITVPVDHPSLSQELLLALNARPADAPSATHTRAHLEHVMRARNLVSRLCTEDGSAAFLDDAAVRAAEEEIMMVTTHVLEAAGRASPKRIGRPSFMRDRVIARALAFIEERRGEPLLIQDLCKAVQVSERTLRTIFQEHFGVGPMRLLKTRQLREIRCALMSPEASDHTVTKIAARFGVWDYSLFARNYKALYGETPLETLRNGTAARNRATSMNATWLRYAARKFSDVRYPGMSWTERATSGPHESIAAGDKDTLAGLAAINNQFDALKVQQQKLAQEIQGYEADLRAFANWAKDFSLSQSGETWGNA